MNKYGIRISLPIMLQVEVENERCVSRILRRLDGIEDSVAGEIRNLGIKEIIEVSSNFADADLKVFNDGE